MKLDRIFFQKMVKFCSAYGCTNRFSKNDISFHKYPLKDKSLLRKWIVATKRENFPPTFNSYLCGEHFLPSDFNFPKEKDKTHLLPNAVASTCTSSLEKSSYFQCSCSVVPLNNLILNGVKSAHGFTE